MKSHSPIQAPIGGKTLEEAKKEKTWEEKTIMDIIPCYVCGKYGYPCDCPREEEKQIKTLREEIESTINVTDHAKFQKVPDRLIELFSSLTEQMIPEEKEEGCLTDEEGVHEYNQAISEMKQRREKLLK